MNTMEQLLIFLPSIAIFSRYFSPYIAAAAGAVFLLGRLIYFVTYVKDPKKREAGFILTAAPNTFLVVGAIVGAVRAALAG
jgi:hypothetical protein